MLVKISDQSNQVLTQELEDLTLQDPNFKRSRVTIGQKILFNMNADKKKKSMRKTGERSGIGFAQDEWQAKHAVSEVEAINQKIRREAAMMVQQKKIFAGENVLDRLDQYSEQFKQSMKETFSSSFVQTGTAIYIQRCRQEGKRLFLHIRRNMRTILLIQVKEPEPIIPSRFGASRFSIAQAPAVQLIPVTFNRVTIVNRFNFNIQREVDQLRKRSRSEEIKRKYSSRSNSRDKYRKTDSNKKINLRRKRSHSSSSSSSSYYSSYSSSSSSSQQTKKQESVKEQEKPIEKPPETLNPPVEGVRKRQSKWDR